MLSFSGDSLPIGHRREGVTFPVSPQRSEAATEHFVGNDPTSSETDSHNDPEMTAEKNLRVHNEGLVPGKLGENTFFFSKLVSTLKEREKVPVFEIRTIVTQATK